MLSKLYYITATIQYWVDAVPQRYVERVYAASLLEARAIVRERNNHAYTIIIEQE